MNQAKPRHARLLIVDDNLADSVLMQRFFMEEKITNQVMYARSIGQARQLLSEWPVDVCFIHTDLPDGSGEALAAQLDPARHSVVMLSEKSDMEHMLKAQRLGAVAYMQKPLSRAMLDRLVQELRHLHWSVVVQY